jgi:hypothetical protein
VSDHYHTDIRPETYRYQTDIRTVLDRYQTISDQYETDIRPVSDQYQTDVRPYQTSIWPISDQYQTSNRLISDNYQNGIISVTDRYQTSNRPASDPPRPTWDWWWTKCTDSYFLSFPCILVDTSLNTRTKCAYVTIYLPHLRRVLCTIIREGGWQGLLTTVPSLKMVYNTPKRVEGMW